MERVAKKTGRVKATEVESTVKTKADQAKAAADAPAKKKREPKRLICCTKAAAPSPAPPLEQEVLNSQFNT